jgi:glutamine---fructose-6-phosphate transaminase (isomerizing)
MSHMLDEIRQQPDVLSNMASRNTATADALAEAIARNNISLIVLVARGTSDNAAVFGKYLFEYVNGIPCALAAPSIVTLYGATLRLDHALVIGISQSGKGTDVVEYLAKAKEMGALTAAITNEADSALAKAADHTLLCHAGIERSVAATKTYTATLGALYLLSYAMSGRKDILSGLQAVPDLMSETLSCDERIAVLAERYRYMDECFVMARGLNQATAAEMALKMAETTYLEAESYSSADFMHGPIAVVDEGYPCFLIAPDGKVFETILETAEKLKAKKAELMVIGRNKAILSIATKAITVPVDVDELFSPLVYIMVGQLFAYDLAVVKGHDPDKPRGLSKVTLTR